jgi:hypothetical protein
MKVNPTEVLKNPNAKFFVIMLSTDTEEFLFSHDGKFLSIEDNFKGEGSFERHELVEQYESAARKAESLFPMGELTIGVMPM